MIIAFIIIIVSAITSDESSNNSPSYVYDPSDGLYHLSEPSSDISSDEISNELPFFVSFIPYILIFIFIISILIFLPRLNAKRDNNLYGMENSFIFNDNGVTVFSKSQNSNSHTQMDYEFFYKVYDSEDCFYFYITKNQLYPLMKKDIEDNKSDDLRNLLISKLPTKKYITI